MNNELAMLIEIFINKTNTSVNSAKEIEYLLDQHYPNDEYVQDTIDYLASYSPNGGDFLYDEDFIIPRLKHIKKYSSQA